VNEFVLYFQPVGPAARDPSPVVLRVGTLQECEKMKAALLASVEFVNILAREPHVRLQITPSAGAGFPVPVRIKNYHSRVGGISGVQPV
jgi:hypothetical protein